MFVNSSTNFTICDGNVTVVKDVSIDLKNQWGNLTNLTNLTNAFNDISALMATAYPLTFSCYYGATEAKQTADIYLVSVESPKNLLLNSLSNMGVLYNSFYYLKQWYFQDKTEIITSE
jgi:hypothetical protein